MKSLYRAPIVSVHFFSFRHVEMHRKFYILSSEVTDRMLIIQQKREVVTPKHFFFFLFLSSHYLHHILTSQDVFCCIKSVLTTKWVQMTLKSLLDWNEFLADWSQQLEKTECVLLLCSLFDFGHSLCDGYMLQHRKRWEMMGIYLTSKLSCWDHFWNEFWAALLGETQFIKGFRLAKKKTQEGIWDSVQC